MDANKNVVEETVDNSVAEPTDALMDDLIKQVEQEYEDEDLAAMPDGADEAAAVDTGDETVQEADEGAVLDAEEGEEPAEEGDERLERLVAREVELRSREAALKEKEAKFSTLEQENTQLRQQLQEVQSRLPEDFFDQLRVNAWEALEKNDLDPEHVAKVILAQKLMKQGKEVPAALLREIKDAEVDYKFKVIERREAELAMQRRAAEFVQKTEQEARQYIRAMSELKPEFSKDAPTVAQVAKAEPDYVFTEIMDEISRDASKRAREPGAQLISFAEAARRVEKRWAEMKKRFGVNPGNQASTNAPAETTARNAAEQPGASTQKKPVKPLVPAKPKTQEELEKEGIDAALAEYKRVESARKKGMAPLRK